MPDAQIIGLDIGGTKTAVVLGNAKGEILSRVEFPSKAQSPFNEYFDELCDVVSKTLAAQLSKPIAISVSIGGPMDALEGIIMSPPNLPNWVKIPLKKLLNEKFNMPVYVEHDGNAGALAEFYFGAGKGSKSIVFLTLGTGFGAGLILDGRLYRGTSCMAGEIGHIRAAEDGPEGYGKRGSMEGFCSGSGIERLAGLLFPEKWKSAISVRELADMARSGDHDALKVFATSGRYLGRAFAILSDLINPDKIVLGALGFRLGELLLKPAMEVFKEEALPQAFEVCRVVPAELGEKIGDVASLCAAIDQGGLR